MIDDYLLWGTIALWAEVFDIAILLVILKTHFVTQAVLKFFPLLYWFVELLVVTIQVGFIEIRWAKLI